jgi:hypothetical protein
MLNSVFTYKKEITMTNKSNHKHSVKKLLLILVILITIICGIMFLLYFALNKWNKLLREEEVEITATDQFLGRDALLKAESADYHSYLLVFPERITDGMKVEKFYYHESPSFNTLYTIYLEYTLDGDSYEKEKTRLSKLKMSYDGEEKTIFPVDTGTPSKSCYVAIYDDYGNYEYAVTDDETKRIVCVFTQYDGFDRIPKEDQLTTFHLAKELWETDKVAFDMYFFQQQSGNRIMPEMDEGKNQ